MFLLTAPHGTQVTPLLLSLVLVNPLQKPASKLNTVSEINFRPYFVASHLTPWSDLEVQ
jgi:hypothetical protein